MFWLVEEPIDHRESFDSQQAKRNNAKQVAKQIQIGKCACSDEHVRYFFEQYQDPHNDASGEDIPTAYFKGLTLQQKIDQVSQETHHEKVAELVAIRDGVYCFNNEIMSACIGLVYDPGQKSGESNRYDSNNHARFSFVGMKRKEGGKIGSVLPLP